MMFNRQSRAASMLRASGVGTLCHVVNVVAGFAYRTAFIALLSERYLGINGLFWDVFRLLALAELVLNGVNLLAQEVILLIFRHALRRRGLEILLDIHDLQLAVQHIAEHGEPLKR